MGAAASFFSEIALEKAKKSPYSILNEVVAPVDQVFMHCVDFQIAAIVERDPGDVTKWP